MIDTYYRFYDRLYFSNNENKLRDAVLGIGKKSNSFSEKKCSVEKAWDL